MNHGNYQSGSPGARGLQGMAHDEGAQAGRAAEAFEVAQLKAEIGALTYKLIAA